MELKHEFTGNEVHEITMDLFITLRDLQNRVVTATGKLDISEPEKNMLLFILDSEMQKTKCTLFNLINGVGGADS